MNPLAPPPVDVCRNCGRRRRYGWTQAQVRQAIFQWVYDHGRPPRYDEWKHADPAGLRPTTFTVARLFGSFAKAIRATGYKPGTPGRPRKQTA